MLSFTRLPLRSAEGVSLADSEIRSCLRQLVVDHHLALYFACRSMFRVNRHFVTTFTDSIQESSPVYEHSSSNQARPQVQKEQDSMSANLVMLE